MVRVLELGLEEVRVSVSAPLQVVIYCVGLEDVTRAAVTLGTE